MNKIYIIIIVIFFSYLNINALISFDGLIFSSAFFGENIEFSRIILVKKKNSVDEFI